MAPNLRSTISAASGSKNPIMVSEAPRRRSSRLSQVAVENPMPEEFEEQEEGFLEEDFIEGPPKRRTNRRLQQQRKRSKVNADGASTSSSAAAAEMVEDREQSDVKFIGEPVPNFDPAEEARRLWPDRYPTHEQKAAYDTNKQSRRRKRNNSMDDDDDILFEAISHFKKAEVDGIVYDLYDDAYVKAEGEQNYICKIIEMFQTNDEGLYFSAQWYYRATDTVIQDCYHIDDKRIFYSDVTNINPLDCLVGKVNIARFSLDIDPDLKSTLIEGSDFFCDTKYFIPYSTFQNFPPENVQATSDNSSTILSAVDGGGVCELKAGQEDKTEAFLLDLFSGCGGMSTGLCLGAKLLNLNLITKWAVDVNKPALETLKQNHKETEVREEAAEDFLQLIKEWKRLCVHFKLVDSDGSEEPVHWFVKKNSDEDEEIEDKESEDEDEESEDEEVEDEEVEDEEAEDKTKVYEVKCIMGISYGKLSKEEKSKKLLFKIRWKKFRPKYDTWEPITLLSDCEKSIQKFVTQGFHANLLPLPGVVHVVCGGPPCQGFSGYNRFRYKKDLLADVKNQQIMVFMDIVQFLKPKFVLMENVVDLLKLEGGSVGRYALGRLVGMEYQARMGLMCAGAYGLPQFRMRVFYWGALPTEKLPPFPLPTHDVEVRGQIPTNWQVNCVAYNEGDEVEFSRKLRLKDVLSDLPAVDNSEKRDSMPYELVPRTAFQNFIRLRKEDLTTSPMGNEQLSERLYDHHPLNLNYGDYQRVRLIPKRKGANFRDLPGVAVGPKNVVYLKEIHLLDSGEPIVPKYALNFQSGTSTKPFGRLWWDEIVPTVITRAKPHNHVILHPTQDRVLTIRENARIQGFPDYYAFCGSVKERYTQIGNAVAIPVARALGYSLGLASRGCVGDDSLLTLPKGMHLPGGEDPLEGNDEVV